MSLRNGLYLCLLAFVVTLAVLIGWRLSDRTLAVMMGVIAGVAASIPTSLIVVWATRRASAGPPPAGTAAEPRIIILQPADGHPAPAGTDQSLTALPAYGAPQATQSSGQAGPRQFTIIGGED